MSERSRQVAAVFDDAAYTYEAVGVPWFRPIAERLVDELDPHIGAHVLDIGCGRGVALPKLSAAVGRSGRIVGIDISPKMLDRARQAVALRGIHNVELHAMDATSPALPKSSFNFAIASLVAFFLPDPAKALRSWHDLLVPTGRLGLSTFAEKDQEWDDIQQLFDPYLPQNVLDARTSGTTGPFASDAGLEDLVAQAGFDHVHTVRWNLAVTFDSPEHWRTWSMSHGGAQFWKAVPESDRDEVMQRAGAILYRRGGVGNPINLNQTVRMTLAARKLQG